MGEALSVYASKIKTVMEIAKCTREEAIKALTKSKGSDVLAVFMIADERIAKRRQHKQEHSDGCGHYVPTRDTYYRDEHVTIECNPYFEEYSGDNIWGTLHGDN